MAGASGAGCGQAHHAVVDRVLDRAAATVTGRRSVAGDGGRCRLATGHDVEVTDALGDPGRRAARSPEGLHGPAVLGHAQQVVGFRSSSIRHVLYIGRSGRNLSDHHPCGCSEVDARAVAIGDEVGHDHGVQEGVPTLAANEQVATHQPFDAHPDLVQHVA